MLEWNQTGPSKHEAPYLEGGFTIEPHARNRMQWAARFDGLLVQEYPFASLFSAKAFCEKWIDDVEEQVRRESEPNPEEEAQSWASRLTEDSQYGYRSSSPTSSRTSQGRGQRYPTGRTGSSRRGGAY